MFTRTAPIRIAVALAAVLATLVAFTTNAAAESAPVVFVDDGPGWADMYNADEDAGSYTFTVNGVETEAYCVQMTASFSRTTTYTTAAPDSVSVPGLDKAAWLATNHSSVGTAMTRPADEHAATQLAIWTFTNSITIDATTVTVEPIRTRALELAAAAASQSQPLVAADTVVAVAGAVDGSEIVWTVTTTADGTPVGGQTVTLTVDGNAQEVTTTGDGTVQVRTAGTEASTSSASVTWNVTTGPAAVLAPADGGQLLITGTASTAQRTASTSVDIPAAPTTTAPPTTPPTTTPPVTEPPVTVAEPPQELPYTGGTFGLDHLVVAAALAAGGAIYLIRRRRQPA